MRPSSGSFGRSSTLQGFALIASWVVARSMTAKTSVTQKSVWSVTVIAVPMPAVIA